MHLECPNEERTKMIEHFCEKIPENTDVGCIIRNMESMSNPSVEDSHEKEKSLHETIGGFHE